MKENVNFVGFEKYKKERVVLPVMERTGVLIARRKNGR